MKANGDDFEAFHDVTPVADTGVYVFLSRGYVQYVGRANRMLSLIAGHDNLSRKPIKPWQTLPGVNFDQILVLPCSPDRADALVSELIAKYKPPRNDRQILPFRKQA